MILDNLYHIYYSIRMKTIDAYWAFISLMKVIASILPLFLFLSACLYLAFSGEMPEIEGKYKPVTIGMTIENIESGGQGDSLVTISFKNIRDCRFVNLTWSQIDKDGKKKSVLVNYLDDKTTGSRGKGEHRSQKWLIKMPSSFIRDFSFVKARHSCHILWDTVTQMYPVPKGNELK